MTSTLARRRTLPGKHSGSCIVAHLADVPVVLRPGSRSTRVPLRHSRGATLVEFALVMPVFVTLLLGIVEFGRAMMVNQLVTEAARQGARLAVLANTTNQQTQDAVKTFLNSTTGVSTGSVTVTITNANAASGNTLTDAQTGDLITVHVSVPFSSASLLPPTYLAGKSMIGLSTMRHE